MDPGCRHVRHQFHLLYPAHKSFDCRWQSHGWSRTYRDPTGNDPFSICVGLCTVSVSWRNLGWCCGIAKIAHHCCYIVGRSYSFDRTCARKSDCLRRHDSVNADHHPLSRWRSSCPALPRDRRYDRKLVSRFRLGLAQWIDKHRAQSRSCSNCTVDCLFDECKRLARILLHDGPAWIAGGTLLVAVRSRLSLATSERFKTGAGANRCEPWAACRFEKAKIRLERSHQK